MIHSIDGMTWDDPGYTPCCDSRVFPRNDKMDISVSPLTSHDVVFLLPSSEISTWALRNGSCWLWSGEWAAQIRDLSPHILSTHHPNAHGPVHPPSY